MSFQHYGKKTETGIPGLDDLIEGGFVPGSTILLRGESGSGKTIFGLRFLTYGALKGEAGVFLSAEERKEDILREGARFGWNLKALEKQNVLYIGEQQAQYSLTINGLIERVKALGAKRIVIDSIPALFNNYPNELRPSEWRLSFRLLCQLLMETCRCTSLLISETDWARDNRFEEYVTKGVIELQSKVMDGVIRKFLVVRKMREVRHSRRLHLYEITNKGFTIFTPQVRDSDESVYAQPVIGNQV